MSFSFLHFLFCLVYFIKRSFENYRLKLVLLRLRLGLTSLLLTISLFAEDFPEFSDDVDSLFQEDSEVQIVDSKQILSSGQSLEDSLNEKSVTFGGEVFFRNVLQVLEEEDNEENINNITFLGGDLFLDIRLGQGIKSYLNFSPIYFASPQVLEQPFVYENIDVNGEVVEKQGSFEAPQSLLVSLNEFFLDINFSRNLYFRAGKQVLKWGKGIFWNPTDFINIDSKTFTDLESQREGTSGVKVHFPYKTLFNFYGFVDLNNTSSLTNVPLSLKAEFLISGFEFSFSSRVQQGKHPIYGFDFSKGFFGWNLYGEAIYKNDFQLKKIVNNNNSWQIEEEEEDIIDVLFGFSKLFDRDTLSIGSEFFFNSGGYEENYFSEQEFRALLLGEQTGVNLFQSLAHSRYYLSVYFSKRDFLWQDFTFAFNTAFNLIDGSFLLSTLLTYQLLNEARIILQPIVYNSFNSEQEGEFTFQNRQMDILLEIAFSF